MLERKKTAALDVSVRSNCRNCNVSVGSHKALHCISFVELVATRDVNRCSAVAVVVLVVWGVYVVVVGWFKYVFLIESSRGHCMSNSTGKAKPEG